MCKPLAVERSYTRNRRIGCEQFLNKILGTETMHIDTLKISFFRLQTVKLSLLTTY